MSKKENRLYHQPLKLVCHFSCFFYWNYYCLSLSHVDDLCQLPFIGWSVFNLLTESFDFFTWLYFVLLQWLVVKSAYPWWHISLKKFSFQIKRVSESIYLIFSTLEFYCCIFLLIHNNSSFVLNVVLICFI